MLRLVPILAALAVAGAASASSTSVPIVRHVTIDAHTIRISGPASYRPGPVTFQVTASGGEQVFHLLQLRPGYTLADLQKEQSSRGSQLAIERHVLAHVRFLGGADVFPGAPSSFTQTLRPGTYYAGAIDRTLRLRAIHVEGRPIRAGAAPKPTGTITGYDFGWRVSGTLPARGTIAVRNHGHQGEVLVISPTRPGTTRAQLGAYLRRTHAAEQAPPPPFAVNGPTVATGMLSPGVDMDFSYDLPPGEYALLTFAPDIHNGQPLALEGMYAVATLR